MKTESYIQVYRERKERLIFDGKKKLILFSIELYSRFTERWHEVKEYFTSEKECILFCREHYKHITIVKVNGKEIINNTPKIK